MAYMLCSRYTACIVGRTCSSLTSGTEFHSKASMRTTFASSIDMTRYGSHRTCIEICTLKSLASIKVKSLLPVMHVRIASSRTARGTRKSVVDSVCPLKEDRSEEHTSELQSLMRISYAVFCLKKKTYMR